MRNAEDGEFDGDAGKMLGYLHLSEDGAMTMPRWLADVVATRLGVEQLTIDTSHCPFLSRPRELAELLVHATTTKLVGPLDPN
jgi:hypothetical protein